MRQPMRVYADTSVFGGALDREFSDLSEAFFERVRTGCIELVVSSVVLEELENAPAAVQRFFEELSPHVRRVAVDEDAYELRKAYLRARVVSPKWAADALHVAVATLSGCQAIVSWNFKHIVNFRRIPLYNAINQTEGYGPIAIHTPPEVVLYDEDE